MTTAKTEAIGQMTRALNGLETAISALQAAYLRATFSEQGKILERIGELGERLDVNRIFLAHLRAAEVTVKKATPGEYARLDSALARLQKMEVETASVGRVLAITAALASSVKQTRSKVSQRTT